jgi:hypothetical protein
MRRGLPIARAIALLTSVGWAVPGVGQAPDHMQVPIEVVEIAGGRAYVSPGEAAGVRRGDAVTLNGRSYRVIAANGSGAIIDLGGRLAKVGARGHASVDPNPSAGPARLPEPHPLAAWSGQWPMPAPPAQRQHPKSVPLGPMDSAGRSRLMFSASGAGILPLSGTARTIERGEVRARLHAEPWHALPLSLDADVAARAWAAGDLDVRSGEGAREVPRVRQLEAAYGDERTLFAALGRLRYAARTVGMLDGARVQAPVYGGITLGAFGGFVPDPLDGKPTTDTSRFGAELAFEDLGVDARPHLALTAQGSRFDGALDERKLTGFIDLFPGESRVGSYVELALNDRDNPWNAPAQEVSAAGADTSVRLGVLELGARLDMQRPERSRWLAAFLPAEWLCTTRASSPSLPGEDCYGDDTRYLAAGDVGLRFLRLALTLGVSHSTTEHADADQTAGFLDASVLQVVDAVRVDGSLMASTGALVQTMGAGLGLGTPLLHGLLDVSVHYRPTLMRYAVDDARFLQHTAGASIVVSPSPEVDVTLDADAVAGRDIDAIFVQTMLAWRPLLD